MENFNMEGRLRAALTEIGKFGGLIEADGQSVIEEQRKYYQESHTEFNELVNIFSRYLYTVQNNININLLPKELPAEVKPADYFKKFYQNICPDNNITGEITNPILYFSGTYEKSVSPQNLNAIWNEKPEIISKILVDLFNFNYISESDKNYIASVFIPSIYLYFEFENISEKFANVFKQIVLCTKEISSKILTYVILYDHIFIDRLFNLILNNTKNFTYKDGILNVYNASQFMNPVSKSALNEFCSKYGSKETAELLCSLLRDLLPIWDELPGFAGTDRLFIHNYVPFPPKPKVAPNCAIFEKKPVCDFPTDFEEFTPIVERMVSITISMSPVSANSGFGNDYESTSFLFSHLDIDLIKYIIERIEIEGDDDQKDDQEKIDFSPARMFSVRPITTAVKNLPPLKAEMSSTELRIAYNRYVFDARTLGVDVPLLFPGVFLKSEVAGKEGYITIDEAPIAVSVDAGEETAMLLEEHAARQSSMQSLITEVVGSVTHTDDGPIDIALGTLSSAALLSEMSASLALHVGGLFRALLRAAKIPDSLRLCREYRPEAASSAATSYIGSAVTARCWAAASSMHERAGDIVDPRWGSLKALAVECDAVMKAGASVVEELERKTVSTAARCVRGKAHVVSPSASVRGHWRSGSMLVAAARDVAFDRLMVAKEPEQEELPDVDFDRHDLSFLVRLPVECFRPAGALLDAVGSPTGEFARSMLASRGRSLAVLGERLKSMSGQYCTREHEGVLAALAAAVAVDSERKDEEEVVSAVKGMAKLVSTVCSNSDVVDLIEFLE